MRTKIIVFFLLCFFPVFSFAEEVEIKPESADSLTKEQCIRIYMDSVDRSNGTLFFQNYSKNIGPILFVQIPGFDYFKNVYQKMTYDDIYEDVYKVYDKHLDLETIRPVVDFYDTPSGRIVSEAMPEMIKNIFDTQLNYLKVMTEELLKSFRGHSRVTSNVNAYSKSKSESMMTAKRRLAYELLTIDGQYDVISSKYDELLARVKKYEGSDTAERVSAKISKQQYMNGILDAYSKPLDEKILLDFVNFKKSPESVKFEEIYQEKIYPEFSKIASDYINKILEPELEKIKKDLKKRLND